MKVLNMKGRAAVLGALLLAVTIGGDPYALRVAELAALHVDRVIVRLPSPIAELVGLVSLRGVMAPVYDLGALLGYTAASSTRWIAILRARRPVAIAFDGYEQHLQIDANAVVSAISPTTSGYTCGVIDIAGVSRSIVDVASILEAIEKRAPARARGE